jgi:hypothetical protein
VAWNAPARRKAPPRHKQRKWLENGNETSLETLDCAA